MPSFNIFPGAQPLAAQDDDRAPRYFMKLVACKIVLKNALK